MIFVTGGSGFVGGHVIEHLVKAGHAVKALARSATSAETVERYGATAVRADLNDVTASRLDGCTHVVHAAARAEEWGTREQFWSANVEGTKRMLDVARAAKVKRFIHIGTEAAFFVGRDLVDIDESTPYPTKQRYLYSETKAEAERLVLAASSDELETISLRPRFVWGPRDASVLPAVSRMAREGKFAWIDHGAARTSTTHVKNVAHAVELALTRGVPGHAYFIADAGTRTVHDFLSAYLQTAGVDLGEKSMPKVVARPAARFVEGVWRLFGVRSQPPLTRFAVDMMSSTVTVSSARAENELGYAPILSVEDGLAALHQGATQVRRS